MVWEEGRKEGKKRGEREGRKAREKLLLILPLKFRTTYFLLAF